MHELAVWVTILSFIFTVSFIFWRSTVNEAIPASVGAFIVLLTGTVSLSDLWTITETIGGAAVTIMATIVMAIVLESFGFFHWAAEKLTAQSGGSGIKLFWYTNLLSFLMTLFVNNDGSILITTPILLMILHNLGLKHHQKLPYLISGALIATASSAPIGVSNIVNLIALKIVNMTLYMSAAMMFIPATIGLLIMATLLFLVFYPTLPKRINVTSGRPRPFSPQPGQHPLKYSKDNASVQLGRAFMRNIILFILSVRISLFVASYVGFPVSLAAVIGSLVLLGWRWWKLRIPPTDIIRKIPWHILIFALSMYIIIYGLHNIGLTDLLIQYLSPFANDGLLHASITMGVVVSVLSNLFNNHPALMIGTLTLTNMGLDPTTLKISYLASVIGSDIGSLLLPIGTLATLMWMHVLRKGKVKISWSDYLKVTILVIPLTVILTLIILSYWVYLVF